MTQRPPKRDLLAVLSDYVAHHKGAPVLVGIGLAILGLALTVVPGAREGSGFLGWAARTHVLLYAGVIVGLLSVLLGDAL
ncbi:MAG: hypothetical protein JXA09_04820 [Anaerolineae bacterium]|nr:hypothetical protein [Anaerolineae bacterium]